MNTELSAVNEKGLVVAVQEFAKIVRSSRIANVRFDDFGGGVIQFGESREGDRTVYSFYFDEEEVFRISELPPPTPANQTNPLF